MKKLLIKIWPFVAIVLVVFLFFWKVFLLGKVPIPGDFIVGVYYPWLDYKWGYQVGVPVKNPVTSDVVSINYPLRSVAVDMLKQGHLPLWNSFMFNGTPLLADFQVGVLSPTMIFYFILPKIWAWTSQIMLQPILAAVFTYLLLRNFGLKKMESLFGGIFYAFSGFNMIWMEWNANTLVAAFIPLLILLLDKFINSKRLYWGVMLSVGICLQIFAGYPQLVAYTIVILLILLFFRREKLTSRKTFLIFLFIFVGLLLSSVLTIPAFEFILNSQRKFEILERELIYLPWQGLITFLAPDYFGNPATKNYFGVGNYTLNTGYSGIVVLMLSIIGVLQNWEKKEVKYLIILFMLSLLIALPTPFASAIFNSHVPAISASSMTRALVLVNLSLAALAGFGIASLLKGDKVKRIGFVFVPLVLLVSILGATLIARINLGITLRNLVLPISLSTIAVFLIILRRKLFIIALCIFALLELFRYGWKYTPFSSPNLVFPDTPSLAFFDNKKRPYRVSPGDVVPMNMWVPYGIESVSGYDAVFPIWWARLNKSISSGNPEYSNLSYYAPFEQYGSGWFDLLNNEYLFVNVSEQLFRQVEKNNKFEKVFQDKSVAIFKNNSALPRAFFVTDWDNRSDEQTLSLLIDPSFPLEKKIIISASTDLKRSDGANSMVSFDFYSSQNSIVNVKTDKEGFLFVSDAWYPGWKAKVDGIDTTIYRADYAFRAVPIFSGEHKVEFTYEPESLKIGALATLITVVFLAGVVIYDYKRIK